MNHARRKEIQELADRIRDALKLKRPVDAEEAVKKLGGKISYELDDDSEIEAMVKKAGDSFEILLSKSVLKERNKFSVAHEIGHLFLHMGYIIDPDRWDGISDYKDSVKYRHGYSEEELEANEFAAAFLMPKSEFEAIAASHLSDDRYNVTAIARAFDVSVSAAKTRGRWLRLFSWD